MSSMESWDMSGIYRGWLVVVVTWSWQWTQSIQVSRTKSLYRSDDDVTLPLSVVAAL